MTIRVGVNRRTFTETEPGGAVQAARKATRALIEHTDAEIVVFGHSSLWEQFSEVQVVSELFVSG